MITIVFDTSMNIQIVNNLLLVYQHNKMEFVNPEVFLSLAQIRSTF